MLPQIILILLNFISLGIAIAKHGEEKTGNENVWTNIIAIIVTYSLLFAGGFFDVFFK
ncbi:MAG TPA: hypothetical protein VLA13_02260 [Massilibacterium sp.]|nr:hypothetical protein [Massilibacterium sp.]